MCGVSCGEHAVYAGAARGTAEEVGEGEGVMSELRILEASAPVGSLRTDRAKTLILVKANGQACFAKSAGEKDALMRSYEPGADLLMLAWTGNFSTDIFLLTQQDLDRHYRPAGSP
jgi:hypothetical protein